MRRDGARLLVNGQELKNLVGINVYSANSSWAAQWGQCGSNMNDDDRLNQMFQTWPQQVTVMRSWFFQAMATRDDTARTRDWTRFDKTLQVARQHNIRVIATIGDQWGHCDGSQGYKQDEWYRTGYRQRHPSDRTSFLDFLTEVGARYRDNPTIFCWQLGNEMECSDAGAFQAWARECSQALKAAAPNHLVSVGTMGGGQKGASGDDFRLLHASATVDLCEYHDYNSETIGIPGDQWNGLAVRIEQAKALNKPLFSGETGLSGADGGRAAKLETKLKAQFAAGMPLICMWSWWNYSGGNDGYEFNETTSMFEVVRRLGSTRQPISS